MAFAGMRIGLLGGTFDPPHAGHRHISEMALKRLALDRLWWLVTPGNPLKSPDARQSFADRVGLARRQASHPRIDVTGFEAAFPDAFTVNTIGFLRRRFPDVAFVWVMGADNLADFHLWRGWREIFRLVPIAVIDRPGFRHAALAGRAARSHGFARADEYDAAGLACRPPPVWSFLSVPLADISSTAIRQRRDTNPLHLTGLIMPGY